MVSSPLQRVGFALADPVRQSVLVALLDGPAFPSDLALVVETSRTNLSNHLACLRGCGLVTATPHGRRLSYELASPSLAHALRDLLSLEAEVCCPVRESSPPVSGSSNPTNSPGPKAFHHSPRVKTLKRDS